MFAPNDPITRQEAAVMLRNTAKVLGAERPVSSPGFADQDKIADWAKDAVDFVFSAEIMGGVGNRQFDPEGTYTRQQAIMTILRLSNM